MSGRALLVVLAVGAVDLDEAVALVEPLCRGVRGERPEPEACGTLALRNAQQLRADAPSGHRGLHVELIHPFAVEDQDANRRAAGVFGDPQLGVTEPRATRTTC